MSDANFRSANCRACILHNADLERADLTDSDFVSADFTGTDLSGAMSRPILITNCVRNQMARQLLLIDQFREVSADEVGIRQVGALQIGVVEDARAAIRGTKLASDMSAEFRSLSRRSTPEKLERDKCAPVIEFPAETRRKHRRQREECHPH